MSTAPDFDPNDPDVERGYVAYRLMNAVTDVVETYGPATATWMLSLALEQAKAELARKLERTN